MKILSYFKDYYDFSFMSHDDDRESVYVRKPRLSCAEARFETIWLPRSDRNTQLESLWWNARKRALQLSDAPDRLRQGCLFVCGKAYPFLFVRGAATVGAGGKNGVRLSRVFDAVCVAGEETEQTPPQVCNFFHTYFSPEEAEADVFVCDGQAGYWRRWSERSRSREIRRFFEFYAGKDYTPLHLTLDSPLLLTLFNQAGPRRGDGIVRYEFILDPALNELDFMRVLPGATLLQELETFLGNVLVKDRMPLSPQTDKEKLLSHGFDAVTSFRKPKKE